MFSPTNDTPVGKGSRIPARRRLSCPVNTSPSWSEPNLFSQSVKDMAGVFEENEEKEQEQEQEEEEGNNELEMSACFASPRTPVAIKVSFCLVFFIEYNHKPCNTNGGAAGVLPFSPCVNCRGVCG